MALCGSCESCKDGCDACECCGTCSDCGKVWLADAPTSPTVHYPSVPTLFKGAPPKRKTPPSSWPFFEEAYEKYQVSAATQSLHFH